MSRRFQQITVTITEGSIADAAEKRGVTIAEAMLNVDAIAIVDVSGSMASQDSRGGQRRFDVATDELRKLQARYPGRVALVAFSDHPQFCPSGIPPFLASGTDLVAALEFVLPFDGTVRQIVVISDGMPNDPNEALRTASRFTQTIDTVYVGPEEEDHGAVFLMELARRRGGRSVHARNADWLAEELGKLLLTAPATP